MVDWKKQLSEIRNVAVKSSNSETAARPINDNLIQELTVKADTLKKEYAKIRRKLRIEDRKEPYSQSQGFIKELEAEQKHLFKQLAEVEEQLRKLSPSTRDSVRMISTKSYERERTKLILERIPHLNSDKNEKQVAKSRSKTTTDNQSQSKFKVNENDKTSLKRVKLEKEVEFSIKAYGILLCNECVDGVSKVDCLECNGTGKLLLQMTTKEVKVRCLDTSFNCKICGGIGEYYKEIETYSQPFCDCETGYVGTESCEICSGLGVIATRSPKNKLSVATFMARLAYVTKADLLYAIRNYLKGE
jgi:hypothetical protein